MENRIRSSVQRKAIRQVMDGFCQVNVHPTAYEVYSQVRRQIPNISLGTVYRNLKMLSDKGDIMEIRFKDDKKSYYDGNAKRHPHFYCIHCECLFDVEQSIELVYDARKFSKIFEVDDYCLVMFGGCRKCRVQQ